MAQAEQLRIAGKLSQAKKIILPILKEHSDYYGALHTLGLIEADQGHLDAALLALTKAHAIYPESSITLVGLATVHLQMGNRDVAQRFIEEAEALGGADAAAYNTLAEILREERDYEGALVAFDKALKLAPHWREALLGKAIVLTQLSRNDESFVILKQLLTQDNKDFAVIAALSTLPGAVRKIDLKRYFFEHKEPPASSYKEHIKYSFSRSAIHHQCEEYQESWAFLEAANSVVAKRQKNNIEKNHKWECESIKALKSYKPRLLLADRDDIPISLFILGPSRSGKTTVESIIGKSNNVKVGYESAIAVNAVRTAFRNHGFISSVQYMHLPEQIESTCREKYISELQDRSRDKRVFTNTSPARIHDAIRLMEILPNIRFVFVKRSIADNALRIFQTNYSSANFYGYDLESIFNHINWYNSMIDCLTEMLPDHCMVVNYESAINDPFQIAKDVGEFIKIDIVDGEYQASNGDVGVAEPYLKFLSNYI